MNPQNLDLSSPLKSRSHAVALIVSDITNPFFAEIIPAVFLRNDLVSTGLLFSSETVLRIFFEKTVVQNIGSI
jgi:hypothetical protein